MDENLDERRGIREYLLGILEDPVMKSQMEEKLLAEDKFLQEISAAEDELIEQYLDDELSPADRKLFISHFLAAPQRKQQLRFHQNLRKYAAAQEPARAVAKEPSHLGWRRFFSMPAFSYALVFVVVLGLGYGGWRIAFNRSNDVETGVAELELAYEGKRPFDSRIVGFDYAPRGVVRGVDANKPDSLELQRATRMLDNAVAEKRNAQSLYGRGKAYLAKGELPDAIRYFEEAVALGPVNARLMSDLGAAYLEAWKKEGAAGKTEMLDKSLQSLDRAIELDPKLPEPRFNRALCLEAMGSTEQANRAWGEYVELDPNSKWTDEAGRNIRRLAEDTEDR
jgi:tetratricopeptide (TPR) repeat protein